MAERCDCDRVLNVVAWTEAAFFSVATVLLLYFLATAGRPERQWYRWEPGEHMWVSK